MTEKRFQYNWKTGTIKDTQSNSQATSNMRILETIINDACYSYEKRIKELKSRNKRQYDLLKEWGDLIFARDWEALEKIVEETEKQEELLQKEFRCDVE